MHVQGWPWRCWSSVWGVFGAGNEETRTTSLASCWCLYCRLWAWLELCSGVFVVEFGQANAGWVLVILMTRFLLTNNIFDWLIYFVVIFCSIRLFFTVNITNFNNYLIHIMKLQVFMLLWSVLKSALVLGTRFVAGSQFIYITVHWPVSAWCVFSAGGDFRTDSSAWSTFLMLLTLSLNTFRKLQVTSCRTFS